MHALWTLEGMDVIDRDLLIEKFADADPRVRMAAVRISERLLREGDDALLAKLEPLAADPDPNVVAQLVLTAGFSRTSAPSLVKDANLSKGAVIYQSLCIGSTGPTAKASTPARDRSLRRWPALRSPTATKPS